MCMRVLGLTRRVEETGDVELRGRLRVCGHEHVDVVFLEERAAPGLAKARRPGRAVPLARRARHLVQLPVEHGQLVRTGAVLARAAEARAERQLKQIPFNGGEEPRAHCAVARAL